MNYILHFIKIILLLTVRHRVRVGNPNEKHTREFFYFVFILPFQTLKDKKEKI